VCIKRERKRKRGREGKRGEREGGKDISKDAIILLRALRKKHFFSLFFPPDFKCSQFETISCTTTPMQVFSITK
jgi:hypothetical protein